MQVNPAINPNSLECIRCGECVSICPNNALKFEMLNKTIGKKVTIKEI